MNMDLNIDDDKLLEMIKTAMDEDMGPVPTQHRHKTPECLSFGRFEQYHLNPKLLTDKEKKHIETCPYCKMNIELFGEEVWHPGLINLLTYMYDPELIKDEIDKENIRRHFEVNECKECLALVEKFEYFIQTLRKLQVTIENNAIMGLLTPQLAPIHASSGEISAQAQGSDEDQLYLDMVSIEQLFGESLIFRTKLMKTRDEEIFFYIEADNEAVLNKPLRFILSKGEESKQRGFIMLGKKEDLNAISAWYRFGTSEELAPFLKEDKQYELTLEPLSIAVENWKDDCELLIKAVKIARTFTPYSLKLWKKWIENKVNHCAKVEEMKEYLDEALEVVDDAIRDQGL